MPIKPEDVEEIETLIAGDVTLSLDETGPQLAPAAPHGEWTPAQIDRQVIRIRRRLWSAWREGGPEAGAVIATCLGSLRDLAVAAEGQKREKIARLIAEWSGRLATRPNNRA